MSFAVMPNGKNAGPPAKQMVKPPAQADRVAGSIFPAMQNFLLAARALGLGACLTGWASYGGEPLLRQAVGVPDDWMLAGHVVIGWPRGRHGPVRRRPLDQVVFLDVWDGPADAIVMSPPGPLVL
jgi:nitroreductase